MSKVIVLSIVVFLFITKGIFAQSGMKETIRGEGEVVKQEISLPAFEGISLGFSGDVVLTPGSTQKVVIEGQQNIIDNINKEVKSGKWRIYTEKNIKDAKPVTIFITLPTITDIGLAGSGSIRSTAKFTGIDDLNIAVSGSGKIDFEYESDDTKVALSGSGVIHLAGTSDDLDISISGSGDVFAKNLAVTDCRVHISGSGDAQVMVRGDLHTQIAGSGNVRYLGDASVKARISGSGTVKKMSL